MTCKKDVVSALVRVCGVMLLFGSVSVAHASGVNAFSDIGVVSATFTDFTDSDYQRVGYQGADIYDNARSDDTVAYSHHEQPVIVVNVNRKEPNITSSGFRQLVPSTQPMANDWARNLRRGDTLDSALLERGRVVHRSPRGIVRVKIGNATVQIKENSREVINVVTP